MISDVRYQWIERTYSDNKIFITGGFWYENFFYDADNACEKLNELISEFLLTYSNGKLHVALSNLLNQFDGHFSIVYEDDDIIFSAVDRIRSYPVYYIEKNHQFEISNNARALRDCFYLDKVDEIGLLEANMSGYVTGKDTLYVDLKQLQAGEFLLYQKSSKSLVNYRYYRYYPIVKGSKSESDLFKELNNVINSVFEKLMSKIQNRPVWVPLSGGLDSRLVLVKLLEHGCKRLQTFSYGVKGNHEAVTAQIIAKKLNVPWLFVPADSKNARNLYNSDIRKKYAEFTDGLNTLPKYLDFEAIYHLHRKKILPSDAIIINGQSGDFITGGHIPSSLIKNPDFNEMFKHIVKKHFSLWEHLLTDKNLKFIKEKFKSQFANTDIKTITDIDKLCAIYEQWEWQERQCKGIVNAQKVYDFFGYSWELPLWDKFLMDFYSEQSVNNRLNQHLFINYLLKYNPGGVFDKLRAPAPPTWSGVKRWLIWITGQTIHLLSNRKQKEKFYNRMFYYGSYHNQYALFGKEFYLKNYNNARSVTSFAVKHWLIENKFKSVE